MSSQVDLHFLLQPTTMPSGLGSWTPQAILTLLIEINPNAGPTDTYPFKTLIDGVANWLYNNHAAAGTLAAQIDNIVTYVKTSFYADVETCLRNQFTFTISPSSNTSTDTAVAVFAMFQELQYNYAPLGTVDFATRTVPPGYVQSVANYFGNPGEPGPTGGSFASLVRTDYFVLLAKQLGSNLQDFAKKNPTATSFSDALASVNYTALAGMASRFMQHGLRLPDPVTPAQLTGLYVLTGQQVALQQAAPGGGGAPQWVTAVTLLPGSGAAGWITLLNSGNGNASITDALPVDLVSKLAVAVQPPTWIQTGLKALEPLKQVPLKYTLIQPLSISSGGTTLSARAIPHAAQIEVAAATSQMYLEITEGPTSGTVQASNDAPPPPPAPFNAAAVLIARIGIRQIQKPGASAGTFYEDVFQLMGTDDQTRELIDTLLVGGPGSFTLDLLIPQGQSAYTSSTAADNVILAKVNLSTVAEPNASIMLHALAAQADPVSPNFALTADAEKFLRLVWECSVVHTGGFFLHYQNFPSAQFSKATSAGGQTSNAPGEASLYVLVNLAPFGTLPDNQPTVNTYHNALLLSSDTATKAVAATVMHLNLESPTQKTPVYVWQPNFPAGSAGFQVTWPNAPYQLPALTQDSSSTDVSNYLEMLYHFLQYQVASLPNATVSLPSNWSAPAGAGSVDHGGGTHSWYFRQTDAVVEYIGANANRYAAVGQPVEFDVRLLDVFGNTLPDALTQKVTPTVAYNDPLISFAHWPGIHVGYQISKGAPDPVLTIDFAYTPSPAQNASSDRMQETIRIYKLVLDQLNDPNTSVTIATTLEAQPLSQTANGAKIKDQLQAYVTNILTSLQSSATNPILLALTLNLTGSFDYVKGLPSDLFVIVVQGVVARASTALDPALISLLPKIGMISHEIFPDLTVPDVSKDSGDDDKQSMANRVFAQAFEAAYVGFDGAGGLLKVGSGPQPGVKGDDDDEQGFGGGIDKAVWALRWSQGDGVNVSFANAAPGPQIQQKPAYYAPPPLSTELLSPTFTVVVYGDQTSEVTHRFSEVDLDGWMSDFLSAVHALFEAQMAPAIATLDPTAYNQLLSDKEAIAQSIAARLESVFVAKEAKKTPSPLPVGDATIAQETFKQALLTSLTNDYATSAIVQVPAQIVVAGTLESPVAGHEDQTIPARLFGKVSTNKPDDGTSPYTISPASLPIPNGQSTACVTFLVAAKQPKNQADLNLKQLFYDIGFLEHDFEMLEGHYGYIPSSWVTFSLPQATTGGSDRAPLSPLMGEVDIPIPLRTFPQAPTLFKQTATADTGDNPLAQLDWDYELTVSTLRDVAQDELWLELTFNDLVNAPGADPDAASNAGGSHPITSRKLERPPPADLLEALARFTWEYPQILPDLQKVPEQAYSSSKDPAPDLALERMVALIGGVRNRIDSWKNPALPDARAAARLQASNANESVPHFSWLYKIEPEKGHDGSPTGNLLVTRTKDDQNLWPPWPTIGSYSTPSSSGEQAVYTLSGKEPAQWVVTWNGLYLMTHQSARIAAWVERNDDLSEDPDLATNPAFIYKTPIVTFGSPIVPLIDIEPAQPQPQQPNFLQAFNDVFTVFTQTDSDNRTPLELKFTLETGYEYVVAKQNDQQLTTRAPIFFARGDFATPSNQTGTPPQTLDAFEKGAAQMLQQWQATQQPNPTGAFISLRLTVFATVSDGQLPLAVFRDIQLPVGPDKSWWVANS